MTDEIKPFYEINANKASNVIKPRVLQWSENVVKGKPSATFPSSVQMWYVSENAKRERGECNEIDVQDIKQSLRGALNSWTPLVKRNFEQFKKIIEMNISIEEMWVLIMQIKKQANG